MQRLRLISVLLLIVFLEACNTPQIRDLEQKNIRLVLITDPETGRRYIDEQESACFTRMYRHSKEYLGSVGQEAEFDVLHCNDMIGYGPEDYVDLASFFEDVRIEVNKKPKK